MIEVTIPTKRNCYATFDSYTGGVTMSYKYRGVDIKIEFNETQWEQFVYDVKNITFLSAHHGQC